MKIKSKISPKSKKHKICYNTKITNQPSIAKKNPKKAQKQSQGNKCKIYIANT